MSTPGMGTMVRYHQATGVDVPALVVATPTNWNSDMSTFYGNSGPSSGEVYLITFVTDTGAGLNLVYNVSEGSAVGDFSRFVTENEDI